MNQPHETRHDAGAKKPAQEAAKADTPESAEPKHVLAEGTGGIRVVRFTLNGQVKSLNLPVSGADLYRLSGGAQKLTVAGKAIANDAAPLQLADDAEVTASY